MSVMQGKGSKDHSAGKGGRKKLICGVVDRAEESKDLKSEVLGAATI